MTNDLNIRLNGWIEYNTLAASYTHKLNVLISNSDIPIGCTPFFKQFELPIQENPVFTWTDKDNNRVIKIITNEKLCVNVR